MKHLAITLLCLLLIVTTGCTTNRVGPPQLTDFPSLEIGMPMQAVIAQLGNPLITKQATSGQEFFYYQLIQTAGGSWRVGYSMINFASLSRTNTTVRGLLLTFDATGSLISITHDIPWVADPEWSATPFGE